MRSLEELRNGMKMMETEFGRSGIGVWVSSGLTRESLICIIKKVENNAILLILLRGMRCA